MTAKEYRETYFTKNSRPTLQTIKTWIRKGEIEGKKIGRQYYVVIDPVPQEITQPKTTPDFSRYGA